MDRVTSGESSADSVQLAVAAFLIAKLLAPFRGGILAGKHGGSAKIRPGLYQVVQDLNSILGIPANGKVINKLQISATEPHLHGKTAPRSRRFSATLAGVRSTDSRGVFAPLLRRIKFGSSGQ